jgi:hypothetical protein
MLGLGDYGSDSDGEGDADQSNASPSLIQASPAKIEFKLPSVNDLLCSSNSPSLSGLSPWNGNHIPFLSSPSYLTPYFTDHHTVKRKINETGQAPQQEPEGQKMKQQKANNNLFRPPQLQRPNVITEDYKIWSRKPQSKVLEKS